MRPGDRVLAQVVDVRDNGIYLTCEGYSGLVNVTELRWDARTSADPFAYASIGDRLEVVVTGVGERCFGASLKRLDPGGDPWRHPKLRPGARLRARLEPPRSWGQFVALEIGEYALLRTPASDPPGSEVNRRDRPDQQKITG